MRILLIAYEFPPSSSPHALRWRYLARGFVEQGHDVHVLMPAVWHAPEAAVEVPEGVTTHRTFAGPFQGVTRWLAHRNSRQQYSSTPSAVTAPPAGLNWRGRTFERGQRAAAHFIFPDVRGEWRPWASTALRRLLSSLHPDVVVSSHEPATTLEVGLIAAASGVPWVIDLGDPVCAPYTPARWRRRAWALEAAACRAACGVVVTTEAARALLIERHGVAEGKIAVITQGFDDFALGSTGSPFRPDRDAFYEERLLELFYAGRFYDFRCPCELVAAVEREDGVRLTIASPALPAAVLPVIAQHPEKFRVLGLLPHEDVLEYQSGADVLISIGNDGLAEQVPGKIYEYMGSGRHVLHLHAAGGSDPAAEIVRGAGIGSVAGNTMESIRRELQRLRSLKRSGFLKHALHVRSPELAKYGWTSLARRYVLELERACDSRGDRGSRVCA